MCKLNQYHLSTCRGLYAIALHVLKSALRYWNIQKVMMYICKFGTDFLLWYDQLIANEDETAYVLRLTTLVPRNGHLLQVTSCEECYTYIQWIHLWTWIGMKEIYKAWNKHPFPITTDEQFAVNTDAYFRPSPLKCWPINRTMSWSVLDIDFMDVSLSVSDDNMPLVAEQAPFCCEVEAISSVVSPLCCWQPLKFACMFEADNRCFLGGGGDTPPSSESDDDASIALQVLMVCIVYRIQTIGLELKTKKT